MVNIIEELIKIENNAEAYIQDSEDARAALPKRISDYESGVREKQAAELKTQIAQMNDNTQAELKVRLAEVEAESRRRMTALERDFSANRDAWEDLIVRRILQE